MKLDLFGDYQRDRTIVIEDRADRLDISIDDGAIDGLVTVTCRILRDLDLVRLEGIVSCKVILSCARCLEEFSLPVSGSFSINARQLKQGETHPPAGDDEDIEDNDELRFMAFDQSTIDITQEVHDALLLEVPIKPLCSTECQGLCSSCGTNLNERTCACSGKAHDARWEALSQLLPPQDDEQQ